LGVSTVVAIVIVIACVALLALAGGALMGNVFGRTSERADPLGDPIEPPGFKRPPNEGDLL
jgi:hypothetical protein